MKAIVLIDIPDETIEEVSQDRSRWVGGKIVLNESELVPLECIGVNRALTCLGLLEDDTPDEVLSNISKTVSDHYEKWS